MPKLQERGYLEMKERFEERVSKAIIGAIVGEFSVEHKINDETNISVEAYGLMGAGGNSGVHAIIIYGPLARGDIVEIRNSVRNSVK